MFPVPWIRVAVRMIVLSLTLCSVLVVYLLLQWKKDSSGVKKKEEKGKRFGADLGAFMRMLEWLVPAHARGKIASV
jgi:hypothetical protein